MSTIIAENENELISQLGKMLGLLSREAIKEHGQFTVGLSGGSLVKFMSSALVNIDTDFNKWKFFFCDERLVPPESSDSTFGAYRDELAGKVNIKEEQFIQIKQGVSAEDAAVDYAEKIAKVTNGELPRFDLLLLGMGPDGHTCSLFPNHPLLDEDKKWIAPITDSPKPPSSRITMTFPVINNAKSIIFAMAGEGKAEMIKRILVDKENLPVTKVKPTTGKLYWILDKDAAKYLLLYGSVQNNLIFKYKINKF